jgi:HK97 family phage major capsid protein
VPFANGNGTASKTGTVSFDRKSMESELFKRWIGAQPAPSVFDNFLSSKDYQARVKGGHFHGITYRVEVPGTVKAAGDPIMSTQFGPRTTDQTVPPHYGVMPTVYDLFRVVPVSGTSSVRYFQATMPITGSPAFIAEGAAKPEVQPRWTPVDAPIETIAEWTAVTLQALDDVPALRAVLEDDLRRLLLLEIDDHLLNGTGTTPDIRGVLNTVGIGTQAFTTDALNTISLAITQIVSSGAGYPTGIVMNPANWQAVRMLNTSGVWYFGSPAEAGVSRVFGVPVVPSSAMPTGFALVGDFSFGTIFERWGVTFIVGLKDDDLIKNLQTIVCEARLALAIRRPSAFVNADVVTP